MRLSLVLWGLGLGLAATANAAPTSHETSSRSTKASRFHTQTTTHLNSQTPATSTPLKIDQAKSSQGKPNKPSETSPTKNSRSTTTSKTESSKPVDASLTRGDRPATTPKIKLKNPSATSSTRSDKSATVSQTKSDKHSVTSLTTSDQSTAASKTKSQGTSRTTSKSQQTTSQDAKEKAKIICESNETDIEGAGTGKNMTERWQETNMDDFLSVLDKFVPGYKLPLGKYNGTLPKKISDMFNGFQNWKCTRGDCDKIDFPDVETCESEAKYGLNAQWYMLADSLKNFHQFIHDLKDDLNDYAIEPLKSTIRTMDQILNPVELVNKQTNTGGEIIAAAFLTAMSSILYETPARAAIMTAGAGTFNFATGALTAKDKGNDNDQQILDRITSQNNATVALEDVTWKIKKQLDTTLENLLEEQIPQDRNYSQYDWSASKLLKGGKFADTVYSNMTNDTANTARKIMVTGVLSTHFDGLVIGKRTKKLFKKNPCDLKRHKLDGIPLEMAYYCLNDVLYIFGRHRETDTPRKSWLSFEGWNHFVDDKGYYFEGITPEDMIKDSEAAENEYGWGKEWRPDDNLLQVAVERAKKSERLSMFTYPIVDLDATDDGVTREITVSPGGPKEHHWDRKVTLRQADRIRYMFIQASLCQTDSKGNRFPYSLWSETISSTQTHFPFKYKGCDWST